MFGILTNTCSNFTSVFMNGEGSVISSGLKAGPSYDICGISADLQWSHRKCNIL